jgi:cob(I)alamin adenosyltransferase
MARIYTRSGDGGQTAYFNGQRVSKADPRVNLYGAVDELNSWLGLCAALLQEAAASEKPSAADGAPLAQLVEDLASLQGDLLELGAILADPERSGRLATVDPALLPFSSHRLEQRIDVIDGRLPPLRRFILPGGHPAAAALHVARTMCRSTERLAVAFHKSEALSPEVIVYLNRLSDLLFVAARQANQLLGHADVPWRAKPDQGAATDPAGRPSAPEDS